MISGRVHNDEFPAGSCGNELREVGVVAARTPISPPKEGSTMSRKHYGILNFAFDAILTLLTAGFWLIWVFVREMRNR